MRLEKGFGALEEEVQRFGAQIGAGERDVAECEERAHGGAAAGTENDPLRDLS